MRNRNPLSVLLTLLAALSLSLGGLVLGCEEPTDDLRIDERIDERNEFGIDEDERFFDERTGFETNEGVILDGEEGLGNDPLLDREYRELDPVEMEPEMEPLFD